MNERERLGLAVRSHREHKGLSQVEVANECGEPINRTMIALLEQGRRVPKPEHLKRVCEFLELPKPQWEPFSNEDTAGRFEFEEHLTNLIGKTADLDSLDTGAQETANERIEELFSANLPPNQTIDLLNEILVFYNSGPVREAFFSRYLGSQAFTSLEHFRTAVEKYLIDALRLFPNFSDAFEVLSASSDLGGVLHGILPRDITSYQARSEWKGFETIPDERLPDLGYIAARELQKEKVDREWLIKQLTELAAKLEVNGSAALEAVTSKTKRKIDSLLRKFESSIAHGVSSPLFAPDADALTREADRLSPKSEEEIERMEATQATALRNLSRYLSADHMDVYVATSMRTTADFVSVNHFVSDLFSHELVRHMKLRHFNPTQSWIDDRVAKGLVEALMLKRASVTIYMAQKSDTFGKDSEASVALGQGKPVIVYVPKLTMSSGCDSERLFAKELPELTEAYRALPEVDEVDENLDRESLFAAILRNEILSASDDVICETVRQCWADFDLYSEVERFGPKDREVYRKWLDEVLVNEQLNCIPEDIRYSLAGVLVATSVHFEKRADIFREVHPLALQVILSTGVLNGILVSRSVYQCASVLSSIIHNNLNLELKIDEDNYRVIEKITNSTIRVISRHELLRNAFAAYYRNERL